MSDRTVIRTTTLMEDAEQILEAIRSGCVDAFVVQEQEGQAVYTLETADLPYNSLVQRMQQGAAMLNAGGEVIYCNPSLAGLLQVPADKVVGLALEKFIHDDDCALCRQLLEKVRFAPAESELRLRCADNSVLHAKFSACTLSHDRSILGVLVTDLTAEKSYADLASRILRLQDEERRNIARELHDSVGQLLAAISMNMNRLRKESAHLDPATSSLLDDSTVMVNQVSREIRTISHLLHPPLLDVAGLTSALRWYIDGFSERSHIRVDLNLPADLGRLSSDIEIAIFRIVQECLTNVYRHSGSDSCSVTIARQGGHLRLEIRDRGKGIPRTGKTPEHSSSGLGHRGMQERVRQLGGTLDIISTDAGTSVTTLLPIASSDEQQSAEAEAV